VPWLCESPVSSCLVSPCSPTLAPTDQPCDGPTSQCQKLLFSATLSRDPAKIDALHLHRPVYISVEDALDPHAEDEGVDHELKFTFPAELSVRSIFCVRSTRLPN